MLLDGSVLIVGGRDDANIGLVTSAQRYNPSTDSWSDAGSLNTARSGHTATLLPNGKVLIAGGSTTSSSSTPRYLASAELCDPMTNSWSDAAEMSTVRAGPTATLLLDGKVLVIGGYQPDCCSLPLKVLASAEL